MHPYSYICMLQLEFGVDNPWHFREKAEHFNIATTDENRYTKQVTCVTACIMLHIWRYLPWTQFYSYESKVMGSQNFKKVPWEVLSLVANLG